MDQALLTAIEEVAARIPVLQADRQYWFIRTNGGLFFDDFLNSGSVGIGYNLVTWAQLQRSLAKNKDAEGGIVAAIIARYPEFDKNKLGRVAGLFSRFYNEMKPGDVVVMPSAGSNYYAFGIVAEGEPFEIETSTSDDKLIYRKRRPVEWVETRPWHKMDSNLYEAFRAPQAMTTLNPYATYLDREMHSLYTKDGLTHIRIDINTTDEISAKDYFSMGNALVGLCAAYAERAGLNLEESEIDIRQNIQSPGRFELIVRKASMGAFITATIGTILFGGHIKSDKLHFDLEMKGAVPLAMEAWKDNRREKQMEQVLAATLPKMSAEQGLDAMRILAGQAPAPSEAIAATTVKSAATAESSAAAAKAATAGLAESAKSTTLADSTSSASSPPPAKSSEH
jgi:restriction system protein